MAVNDRASDWEPDRSVLRRRIRRVTPEEYARRIQEVEASCDQRMFEPDYRRRWYPPDAEEVMRFLLECVDADQYDVPRPELSSGRPWMDKRLTDELARFDERWRSR